MNVTRPKLGLTALIVILVTTLSLANDKQVSPNNIVGCRVAVEGEALNIMGYERFSALAQLLRAQGRVSFSSIFGSVATGDAIKISPAVFIIRGSNLYTIQDDGIYLSEIEEAEVAQSKTSIIRANSDFAITYQLSPNGQTVWLLNALPLEVYNSLNKTSQVHTVPFVSNQVQMNPELIQTLKRTTQRQLRAILAEISRLEVYKEPEIMSALGPSFSKRKLQGYLDIRKNCKGLLTTQSRQALLSIESHAKRLFEVN